MSETGTLVDEGEKLFRPVKKFVLKLQVITMLISLTYMELVLFVVKDYLNGRAMVTLRITGFVSMTLLFNPFLPMVSHALLRLCFTMLEIATDKYNNSIVKSSPEDILKIGEELVYIYKCTTKSFGKSLSIELAITLICQVSRCEELFLLHHEYFPGFWNIFWNNDHRVYFDFRKQSASFAGWIIFRISGFVWLL